MIVTPLAFSSAISSMWNFRAHLSFPTNRMQQGALLILIPPWMHFYGGKERKKDGMTMGQKKSVSHVQRKKKTAAHTHISTQGGASVIRHCLFSFAESHPHSLGMRMQGLLFQNTQMRSKLCVFFLKGLFSFKHAIRICSWLILCIKLTIK